MKSFFSVAPSLKIMHSIGRKIRNEHIRAHSAVFYGYLVHYFYSSNTRGDRKKKRTSDFESALENTLRNRKTYGFLNVIKLEYYHHLPSTE